MIGGVRRAHGEDLAGQREAPVEVPLADRVQGPDDRDLIHGRTLVAEHLGHAVDLVEPAPLVEQQHQPADQQGLGVSQLDRPEVRGDGLVGGTGELGDLPVRARSRWTIGDAARRFPRPSARASSRCSGGAAADLVDQEGRLREPPRRPLVALGLADLVHELGGVGVVAGRQGQVEEPEPDAEVLRLEGRQLAPVLPRQAADRQAGSRPLASRSRNAGRSAAGSCWRVSASFATAARAASPPSRPQ